MTNYTNKMQEQVQEFHKIYGHPTSDKPTPLDLERAVGRSKWGTGEELVEFLQASSTNQEEFTQSFSQLLIGLREAFHKQKDKSFPKNDEEKLIAQADAIADRLYFTFGDIVEMGVDIQPIFDAVHTANLSKLFTNEETGEKYVKYNEAGKVMKSPEFAPPEDKIKEEIKNQLNPKKVTKPVTRKKKKEVELTVSEPEDVNPTENGDDAN